MAESPAEFAGVLREMRVRGGLTQQELANRAGISLRTVSNLERGAAAIPQRETVRLLGDALGLIGAEWERFEVAARGRPLAGVSAAAAVRSLPRDVAAFTGRQRELDQLATSALTAGGVVGIHAIGGMAGVGKTTFAVHAAHRLAGRFPDGQVFLPLHGHTPGRPPVDPADALATLLLTTGIPPAQVPPLLEARAAMWRDRAAGRRLLLVLDDAATSEQVRPLLPGTGGSLVLVTSRRHLPDLDAVTAISLDILPPGEAAELLVRLAARPGLRPGDPAVAEIIRLCGYLPLAVGMVARQLRHHPAWSAQGRAEELAATRDRLELMEGENLSVAAAFDLSYATLTPGQQRLFRRLGLFPGSDACRQVEGPSCTDCLRRAPVRAKRLAPTLAPNSAFPAHVQVSRVLVGRQGQLVPVILCYCVAVKNITVSVPDEVYRNARVAAAQRDTSLSALVVKYLERLSGRMDEFARLETLQHEVQAEISQFRAADRLSRDEVHDRAVR